VKDLARNINDYFWYRRQVSEGAKGPIVYEFTRRQGDPVGRRSSAKIRLAANPPNHLAISLNTAFSSAMPYPARD
jgi:hypothetical protein